MDGYRKSVKLSLYLVYIFSAVLALLAVTLPLIVTWYVEVKGRNETLPAIIMLTCYPCLPFAAAALVSVKKILNNVLAGLILGDKNLSLLRIAAISFFAIMAITLGAAKLYKPFYIIAAASAVCGFTFFVVRGLFHALLEKQREKDLESIEENL